MNFCLNTKTPQNKLMRLKNRRLRKKSNGEQLPQVANFQKKVTAYIKQEMQPILKRLKSVLKNFKKVGMINRTIKNKNATESDLGAICGDYLIA
ncbi:hypothetical protein ABCW44_06975 [Mannheimia haemolytica]|uniref:hypothetical protein n=1 Tax=Mannheimia haemolytica TaxID=75985 RepID=UPI00320913DE